LRHRAD
jgi:exocyst complex protein 7